MDYNNNQQPQQQDPYQQPQQPMYQQPYQQPMYQQPYQQKQNNPLAIAGLVCGVLSLIFVWFVSGLGLILGIAGIVLGAIGMKQAAKLGSGKGMAIGGLVCGIICVAIFIIVVAVAACVVSEVADVFDYYY